MLNENRCCLFGKLSHQEPVGSGQNKDPKLIITFSCRLHPRIRNMRPISLLPFHDSARQKNRIILKRNN